MYKTNFRYLVLWLFLFGIIVIVFLQFISGFNIRRLTDANKALLNELQEQSDLRRLESDMLIVESDIRGAIITGNAAHLQNVAVNINQIDRQFESLSTKLHPEFAPKQTELLRQLIAEKKQFSIETIRAFNEKGKGAAEELVNTNRGKILRDSIELMVSDMERSRQENLKKIIGSIQTSGKNARIWGAIITSLGLIALIAAFLYIINQGRQQQRMIQALNESERRSKDVAHMKEQFLANMSHEIRTPMNSILGFTNLLRRTELSQGQREYVQNIHSAGENLLALVNDILDLSKIEAGMMQLEETRFSLRSMISSVGAMFHEKTREKGLNFEVQIDKDTPDILSGDAVRLTQILVNLISNAVKFTESGSITVKTALIRASETAARISITVSDTGIGIPREKQSTIFERFQQAEAATTRRFGGTGLGLSIVKQLVELQKGRISLKSEEGKGSSFIIELTYGLPDLNQLYSSAITEQEERVSLTEIKVLIAEDNPMNQHLIAHLMKSWSIDFQIVNNGREVLEALKKEAYALILMDIQMPEMDGYTATSIIRRDLKMNTPIIAMTAHAMIGEKEKCLELGMNDYVSKPIRETDLYNMIARHAQYTASKEPVSERLVNLDYLHELSGNDVTFEKEILQQFIIQCPSEIQQLGAALDAKDNVAARRVAHSLKSTFGYVGLSAILHPYLEQIEKQGIENGDGTTDGFKFIRETGERAIGEVNKLLENGLG